MPPSRFAQRILTPERMDRDDVPDASLRQSLGFIRKVNRYLGGTHAVLGRLRRWSARWPQDRPVTILDLATGSADIPLAIARWAQARGLVVRITAVDRHPATLALAAAHLARDPAGRAVTLLRADALRLPLAPGSFDYVLSSMFLHHLPDIQVMTVLKAMDDVARRGVIWNDLLRHRRAYWWTRLLTWRSDPVVQHDGPVSVLAGFRKREVLDMRDRLELGYLRYRRHFAHRFTLAGEKPGARR